jgi:hypothetical protein
MKDCSFYQETNIHDHNITFYLLLICLQLFNVQQIIDDYSLCFQIYDTFFCANLTNNIYSVTH